MKWNGWWEFGPKMGYYKKCGLGSMTFVVVNLAITTPFIDTFSRASLYSFRFKIDVHFGD